MQSKASTLTSHKKGGPARRIFEMDPLNRQSRGILGIKQNGSEIVVAWVEDLTPCKFIPPPLAIAVENAITIDLDVFAAPFPEHEAVLEGMTERIGLPVWCVVGELDLAVEFDMDIVQEGQVKGFANDKCLTLWQEKSTTVVGTLQTAEEFIGYVVSVGLGSSDFDLLPPGVTVSRLERVLFPEL